MGNVFGNLFYAFELTLIGMSGYTFISLSFLDQILSGKFSSKNFKKFVGENWHQSGQAHWVL